MMKMSKAKLQKKNDEDECKPMTSDKFDVIWLRLQMRFKHGFENRSDRDSLKNPSRIRFKIRI